LMLQIFIYGPVCRIPSPATPMLVGSQESDHDQRFDV
jgi:hypothetical protein